MKYTLFHQYKVSQLSLGTIQLGMDYGIANASGAPDRDAAFSILDFARRSGINTFDTARTYGKAEEVIGQYFHQTPLTDDLIISKFKYDWTAKISVEEAWKRTHESVKQSIQQLGLSSIPLVLYHQGPDEPMEEVQRIVPTLMARLKETGAIERSGISLYYSKDARHLAETEDFEAIQIPLNLLDHDVVKDGTIRALSEKGMLVFVRSVFLQGLFFRNPDELTGTLTKATPYLKQIRQLARDHRMTVAEMAFGVIRDFPELHSLVVGAENKEQIETNIQLLSGPAPSDQLRMELESIVKNIPIDVITPGRWQSSV